MATTADEPPPKRATLAASEEQAPCNGPAAPRPAALAGELVLEFRGTRVETADEIAEIEDALVEVLADGDALAGHEMAADARRILIFTRDAAATLRRVLPFLERAGLAGGLRADLRTDGTRGLVPIWPRDPAPAGD